MNQKELKLMKQCSSEITAVDLGLPSGRLWADRNVGAKSPEDYGAFFSWGNVEPHFPKKDDMDWGDSMNAFDYDFSSDEYRRTPGYKLEGDIDVNHDAASFHLGKLWRMAQECDFVELSKFCVWTRKTVNGVNGYLVTSKVNGNVIFFPCSGFCYGSSWNGRGSNGYYWSRSLYSAAGGRILGFYSGGVYPRSDYSRFGGFAVRPVQ